MVQAQRKLQMKTTSIGVDLRTVIIGVLRREGTTPLIEAPFAVKDFNERHGTNVKLLSPRKADYLIVDTDKWVEVRDAFPSPLSAVIAYEKPGKRLGSNIVFEIKEKSRLVLATGRYEGMEDVALVAPNITAEDFQRDGNDMIIVVPEERLTVVSGFPSESGWHMPHAETTIPHGEGVRASLEARYITRLEDSSYVGFLVRICRRIDGFGIIGDLRLGVYANYAPSSSLGVAVEIPEGDLGKIKKLSLSEPAPAEKKSVVELNGVTPEEFETLLKDAETNLLELYDKVMLDHVPHLDVIKRFFQALKRRD